MSAPYYFATAAVGALPSERRNSAPSSGMRAVCGWIEHADFGRSNPGRGDAWRVGTIDLGHSVTGPGTVRHSVAFQSALLRWCSYLDWTFPGPVAVPESPGGAAL